MPHNLIRENPAAGFSFSKYSGDCLCTLSIPVMASSASSKLEAEYEIINIKNDSGGGENQPLIPKDGLTSFRVAYVHRVSRYRRLRSFLHYLNWRSFIAALVLWVSYFLCSMGYSTIGPFFPQEVSFSVRMCRMCCHDYINSRHVKECLILP